MLLALLFLVGGAAFGAERFESIAGVYQIDITNLGMPLVFYLRIEPDGAFMLSPSTAFDPSESRGEGVIAESGGVHMMIYKEHTSETPKTATFVLDGPNLLFQSTLPYGSSNIINSAEDPDDPTIVYTLTAETLALSEYYGTYAGSHSKQAMGSTVDYVYTLTLKPGLRYVFSSEFAMGGTVYTFTETGSWDVDGDQFTLMPADQPAVQGTIGADGAITVGIRPSEMAGSRTESVLRIATHAEYAGTYVGEKVTPMFSATSTMVLDMFGAYQYSADVGMPEPFEESGSYDVSGSDITFQPDAGDPYTATLENFVLAGSFRVIGNMPGTQMSLYNQQVLGTFSGSATHEEVEYTTVLSLHPDGSFELLVSDDAGQPVVEGAGGFLLQRGMTLMVVLPGVEPAPMCTVSQSGLNFSIALPGMTDDSGMGGLGFSLKRQ
jgi:hypothetical protein